MINIKQLKQKLKLLELERKLLKQILKRIGPTFNPNKDKEILIKLKLLRELK